jgi:hypothetical protein
VFLLPLMMIYAITVPADSGALRSSMAMAANPDYRGATMALHSTVGLRLSALGAWAVGVALDAAGGLKVLPHGWLRSDCAMLAPALIMFCRTITFAPPNRADFNVCNPLFSERACDMLTLNVSPNVPTKQRCGA